MYVVWKAARDARRVGSQVRSPHVSVENIVSLGVLSPGRLINFRAIFVT